MTDLVRCERPGPPGVALLTMARGAKRNALSAAMKRSLTEAALALGADPEIRAVVLAAEGPAFSAGNDILEEGAFAEGATLDAARRLVRGGAAMTAAFADMPALTLAAVSGPAIGGGAALAFACDIRVFAPYAWIRMTEVELGLPIAWDTMPRLVALAGPARAKWIAAACQRVDAPQALEWGLCEMVSDDPVAAALAVAADAAAKPRVALGMVKETVNRLAHPRFEREADADQVILARDDPEGARRAPRRDAPSVRTVARRIAAVRTAAALRVARSFAIGAAGAAAAAAAGAPLPFLLGAVAATLAAGALGVGVVRMPRWIGSGARVAIGVLVGSSIGPELLDRVPEMGATALAVPIQVAASILLGAAYLRRASAMTAGERLLGALPGGLASVVLSLEETGRDIRRISVLHTVRVAVVVACIPVALAFGLVPDGPAPAGLPSVLELGGGGAATLLALALAGWGARGRAADPGRPAAVAAAPYGGNEADGNRRARPVARAGAGRAAGSRNDARNPHRRQLAAGAPPLDRKGPRPYGNPPGVLRGGRRRPPLRHGASLVDRRPGVRAGRNFPRSASSRSPSASTRDSWCRSISGDCCSSSGSCP